MSLFVNNKESSSQLPDAQECLHAFLQKRQPRFQRPSSALFDGKNERS